MSWRKESRRRQQLIRKLEQEFKQVVKSAEAELSVRIGAEFARLKLDDEGNIRPTVGNVRFSRRLNEVFDNFRKVQQKSLIKWLIGAVRKILGQNSRYFDEVKRGGAHDRVLKTILESLGYNYTSKRITKGSFLDDLTRANSVKTTILRRTTSAVLGGLTLVSLASTVNNLLKAGSGLLSKFFGRATRDIFIRVDRQAQNLYAKSLDLNFALYAGTIKDNTRPFCKPRVQNVYTREEVERWQSLDWIGKIPGADVKEVCGGYQCRHHLSWVSQPIAEAMGRGINQYS